MHEVHAFDVSDELLQAGADDLDGHAGRFVAFNLLQLFLQRWLEPVSVHRRWEPGDRKGAGLHSGSIT